MKQKIEQSSVAKFQSQSETYTPNEPQKDLKKMATNQQRFAHEDERERRDGPGGN